MCFSFFGARKENKHLRRRYLFSPERTRVKNSKVFFFWLINHCRIRYNRTDETVEESYLMEERGRGMNKKKGELAVKILFVVRILLWIVAAAATVYWIVWSFKMYDIVGYDVHAYATAFRPLFYKALIVTFVSICVSFGLRSISDRIKKCWKLDEIDESL